MVSGSLAITDTVGRLSQCAREFGASRDRDDGAHDPVAVAAARPADRQGSPAGRATFPAGSRLHPRTAWTAYGGTVRFEFALRSTCPALAAIGVTPLTARVDVETRS